MLYSSQEGINHLNIREHFCGLSMASLIWDPDSSTKSSIGSPHGFGEHSYGENGQVWPVMTS